MTDKGFLSSESAAVNFQPSFAEEKIEVIPIIQSSKGLSGKNFNYLEGKPELRLLKVKIPVGLKTPIHTHPSPMLIHVTRGCTLYTSNAADERTRVTLGGPRLN